MLWHFCHPIMTVMIGISCDFSSMKHETVWRVLLIYSSGLLVGCANLPDPSLSLPRVPCTARV